MLALRSEAASTPLPRSVRVSSELRLVIGAGGTILDRRETGALRFRFPHAHGRPPEAILVNVAGGLTGGDGVSMDIAVGADAALTVTTATAERIYRSNDDPTMISTTVQLDGGATLVWLPQESILHEGARLVRKFDVSADASSGFLVGDMVYLGRRASGEGFEIGMWKDRWRISIGGQLVFADETQLTPDSLAHQHRAATLDDAVVLGSLLLRAPSPDQALAAVRHCIAGSVEVEAGVSLLDGLVCVRLMAKDAASLRAMMVSLADAVLPLIKMPMPRALASS